MLYPIFLEVADLPCLVVGGGRVGIRKARTLVEAGAMVTVVEPSPAKELVGLAKAEDRLHLVARGYAPSDLLGIRLVFAATGYRGVNRQVAADAGERGIPCNVADAPDTSDFVLPSLIRRGDLTVAFSTGGKSPALSRKLRMELENRLDAAYAPFLVLMGRIRTILLEQGHDPDGHKETFRDLVSGPLLNAIRNGDRRKTVAAVANALGDVLLAEHLVEEVLAEF